MIPIECPKCGRGGSVPPDRLNARLVCKACHTVFHLDNTGRMVLGEPQSFDMKTTKARADEVSSLADFDLAQTWADIPMPVKYGVPAVLLGAILWVNFGTGGGSPDYIGQAESLVRSVINNDRSRAVSYATNETSESAGQWFDVVHGAVERNKIGSDVVVNPSLLSGNGQADDDLVILVVLAKDGSTDPPVTVTLPMKKEGGYWKFDAARGLEDANKANATAVPVPTGSNNRR